MPSRSRADRASVYYLNEGLSVGYHPHYAAVDVRTGQTLNLKCITLKQFEDNINAQTDILTEIITRGDVVVYTLQFIGTDPKTLILDVLIDKDGVVYVEGNTVTISVKDPQISRSARRSLAAQGWSLTKAFGVRNALLLCGFCVVVWTTFGGSSS